MSQVLYKLRLLISIVLLCGGMIAGQEEQEPAVDWGDLLKGNQGGKKSATIKSNVNPMLQLIEDAKKKRLNAAEGLQYYKNLAQQLAAESNAPRFKLPPDISTAKGHIDPKYVINKTIKGRRINERQNLLTGEALATPQYGNEPKWERVDQTIKVKEHSRSFTVHQIDTLKAGGQEKTVHFRMHVYIASKKLGLAGTCYYAVDHKNYFYSLPMTVERDTDGRFVFISQLGQGKRSVKLFHIAPQGVVSALTMGVDKQMNIVPYSDRHEGAVSFNASLPTKKVQDYPRKPEHTPVTQSGTYADYLLDRYNAQGEPLDLTAIWEKAAGKEKADGTHDLCKPTARHKNVLNVFGKRHVKN